MSRKITVGELLEMKYLRDISRVAAGKKGLDKPVSWVHILEMRDIVTECVDGGELILTTGIGFSEDKKIALSFVESLIRKNVAALCIETVFYYKHIDEELLALAESYDFPIIEIYQVSRFVDISKGINTILLNNDSDVYHSADKYDMEIQRQGLTTIEDLISFTGEYVNLDVMLQYAGGKTISSADADLEGKYLSAKPVMFLGAEQGQLIFAKQDTSLTEYERLIQNRLMIHMKDILQEKQLQLIERLKQNSAWVEKWLEGSLQEHQAREHLKKMGISEQFFCAYVCTIQMTRAQRLGLLEEEGQRNDIEYNLIENSNLGIALLLNRFFEEQGIIGIPIVAENSVSFILFVYHAEEEAKIVHVVNSISESAVPSLKKLKHTFFFGKRASGLSEIPRSYLTSIELIQDEGSWPQQCVFFDKLYLSRLLRELYKTDLLGEYCNDYLGELTLKKNETLLETLKSYLANNCSKQETAESLFVARQTLYYRIEKLREILGSDFDQGERRLAIEVAVRAKEYIQERERFGKESGS